MLFCGSIFWRKPSTGILPVYANLDSPENRSISDSHSNFKDKLSPDIALPEARCKNISILPAICHYSTLRNGTRYNLTVYRRGDRGEFVIQYISYSKINLL